MKIKILYLGRSAKEVELPETATVMQAIVKLATRRKATIPAI